MNAEVAPTIPAMGTDGSSAEVAHLTAKDLKLRLSYAVIHY